MELPVTVMGDKMQTMETARTTETGLTSSRVSILVTVGIRVVVSSPARVVDGNGVSVTCPRVDIVTLAQQGKALHFSSPTQPSSGQVLFVVDVFASKQRHDESSSLPRRIKSTNDSRQDHTLLK